MGINFYRYIKFISRLTGLIFLISLVSCGGSNSGGDYSVGGTVTGLQGSITLRNNITDVLTLSSSGSFSFNTKLNSGVSYNVDIQTQPAGQTCTVSNASGIIDNADVSNVMVACVDNITLSGSYQAAPLIQVDSDVNDPFDVPNVNNGSQAAADPPTTHSQTPSIDWWKRCASEMQRLRGSRVRTPARSHQIVTMGSNGT